MRKNKMTMIKIASVVLMSQLISGCANQAPNYSGLPNTSSAMQNGSQVLQMGQAISAATLPGSAGLGLTSILTQQLGISQPQALGGAGAIFQMAKSNMQAAAFSKLSSAVPGMQTILAAAPIARSTGLGGLAGLAGAGSSTGSLLGLAGSFQQLGLGPNMIQQFLPIVMQYVQGTGGGAVSSALQAALMGGQ